VIADYLGAVGDPAELAARLDATPGVVAHGLFPPALVHDVFVARGDRVEQGDVVGSAGPRLFFGARVGDAYVDPALLLGGGPLTVHLVPLEPADVRAADERRALSLLAAGHRAVGGGTLAWLRRAGSAAVDAVGRHAGAPGASWRAVAHEAAAMDPLRHLRAVTEAVDRWIVSMDRCTRPRARSAATVRSAHRGAGRRPGLDE
jgi:hypothetical protein